MSNRNTLLNIIKKHFPAMDTTRLDVTAPLEQQGLDSLDMTTLLFAVENQFGTSIPTAKVSSLRSLLDIERFLEPEP